MTGSTEDKSSVINWLKAWAAAIRENDLDAGRSLFAEDVSGFGTITLMTDGLDDLIERQWTRVWANTTGYDFDWDKVTARLSPDGLQAAVQALWASTGKDESGGDRAREGRATIILTRETKGDDWKCVHTHFSMWPNSADIELLK
ncbi:YybH family protein [Hyphococcus sp.]|uniref:YybH family protein n=1 Tax=Hyphococcus sp. TaxID=2038636 RepID=UPI003D097D2A